MVIELTVQQRSADGTAEVYHYAFEQDEVLVGRDEAADVRLPHPAISQVHLRLQRGDGEVLHAVDAGSTNGTLLDGEPLAASCPAPLGAGSRLTVGPFTLIVGGAVTPPASARPITGPLDTAAFARQMARMHLGAAEEAQPYLEVENGPQRGQRLLVPPAAAAHIIGRGEECDLRLDDADASRQHLEVRRVAGVVLLADLDSKNGCLVNGAPVIVAHPAAHDDEIRLGQTRLRFVDPAERYLRALQQAPAPPASAAAGAPAVTADEAAAASDLGDGAALAAAGRGRGGAAHVARGRGWSLLVAAAAVVALVAAAALIYLLL